MDTAMLDQYVQLLNSADAEKRRQAIVALGRSKNPAALRPLAEAYRSEQDDTLRQLVLQAGQFIKSQISAATAANAPAAPAPQPVIAAQATSVAAPAEPAAAPAEVQMHRLTNTGHGKAKQAKAWAEEALSLSLQDDPARAIKAIKKAYKLYPALMQDTYYSGLAMTVLHCGEGEVIERLEDAAYADNYLKSVAQDKTDKAIQSHVEETTGMSWLGVGLDLIIFSLIMALGPVLLLVIGGQSLESWLLILVAEGGELEKTYVDILQVTRAVDMRALAIMSGTLLVSGFVSLIIQCVAIHISATKLLGGTGTLRYLMYKLISYYNRILITVFVTLIVSIWLLVSNGIAIVMIPVLIGLSLFGLMKVIKLGNRIGEAYKFTGSGGCLSVGIAGVVLVVSNGAIAYFVYMVLANVLLTLIPTLGR